VVLHHYYIGVVWINGWNAFIKAEESTAAGALLCWRQIKINPTTKQTTARSRSWYDSKNAPYFYSPSASDPNVSASTWHTHATQDSSQIHYARRRDNSGIGLSGVFLWNAQQISAAGRWPGHGSTFEWLEFFSATWHRQRLISGREWLKIKLRHSSAHHLTLTHHTR
jgi:hypothetical protein